MDGKELEAENEEGDYTDSLHYRINQSLKSETAGQLCQSQQYTQMFGQGPKLYASAIKFGQTNISEYQVVQQLGKGTYGEVNKCIHSKTNSVVALKTFLFENVTNGINYSTMREISLLKQLTKYPNFVRLLDVLEEWGTETNKIHCVFEFCESTLFQRLQKRSRPLEWHEIKHIMVQLLEAINILHGKMILHRDIKPENILVTGDGVLKLADFGLAKKASFLQRRKSNSIVSLWYRAPEIILGSEDYLLGVDMWSLGCLFGELMQTKPVYFCKSDAEVLDRAFRILGTPTQDHCAFYHKLKKWGSFKFKEYPKPENLQHAFPHGTPEALDLLHKMMNLDPKKRITAKEALAHPFFYRQK